MSDIDTGAAGAPSRKRQAKAMVGQAGEALKTEAQSFANAAQDRVRAEAERGTQAATKTLGDFANAVRRAGDELAGADQSPATRLVQKAADGLETFSRSIEGKSPGDLLNDVRDFGRRNPIAFIGSAVLVGLAVGRFARASEPEHVGGLSDEERSFVEEEAFEGAPEARTFVSGEPQAGDDLGDLSISTGGFDDGTSGIGEPDATSSPPLGGR